MKNFHRIICFAVEVKIPTSFWTSGANEGEHCDVEQIYSWCSNRTRMKRQEIMLPWADESKPTVTERCLSVTLNKSTFALDAAECGTENYAICEVYNTQNKTSKVENRMND